MPSDTQQPTPAQRRTGKIVSESQVDRAVTFLTWCPQQLGDARADVVRTEQMLKHIKALVMAQEIGQGVGKAEAIALASERYKEAIEAHAAAVSNHEQLKAQKEGQAALIEVWRTQEASFRSHKL